MSLRRATGASVLPTELICIILSDVAACFPERDQYNPGNDGPACSYTPAEKDFKRCFASYSLVCRMWNALARPYLQRVMAFRCCNHVKKGFTYSVSLQEVLDMLESKPELFKNVRHLRLLPIHIHTQLRDPLLLPQILHRFKNLRVLELVNLDFTLECIKRHLCDPESIKESYSFTPLKLDRFALYATPERLPSVNVVLFLLSLVSHATSVLLQTDPKVLWSVYDHFGRSQLALWHSLQSPIIPRLEGTLLTSSLSIKSRNLPQEIVQYLVWSRVFRNKSVRELYLQLDSMRAQNLTTILQPLYPDLVELTLDLSYFLDSSQVAITPIRPSFKGFQSLQTLTLKFPLTTGTNQDIFTVFLAQTAIELGNMHALKSLLLVVVDLEYARADGDIRSRTMRATAFAMRLLLFAAKALAVSEDPAHPGSLESWGLRFEDRFGGSVKLSEEQRALVRTQVPGLCESGVFTFC